MEFKGVLEKLQGFVDLDKVSRKAPACCNRCEMVYLELFRGVDLLFDILLGFDVDRCEGRLFASC